MGAAPPSTPPTPPTGSDPEEALEPATSSSLPLSREGKGPETELGDGRDLRLACEILLGSGAAG